VIQIMRDPTEDHKKRRMLLVIGRTAYHITRAEAKLLRLDLSRFNLDTKR
jgi:hypothetical protein